MNELDTPPGSGDNLKTCLRQAHDSLRCPICLGTMKNPCSSECNDHFCRKCISDWLARKPWCPCCKKKLSKRSLKDNDLISTLIAQVRSLVEAIKTDTASEFTSPFLSQQVQPERPRSGKCSISLKYTALQEKETVSKTDGEREANLTAENPKVVSKKRRLVSSEDQEQAITTTHTTNKRLTRNAGKQSAIKKGEDVTEIRETRGSKKRSNEPPLGKRTKRVKKKTVEEAYEDDLARAIALSLQEAKTTKTISNAIETQVIEMTPPMIEPFEPEEPNEKDDQSQRQSSNGCEILENSENVKQVPDEPYTEVEHSTKDDQEIPTESKVRNSESEKDLNTKEKISGKDVSVNSLKPTEEPNTNIEGFLSKSDQPDNKEVKPTKRKNRRKKKGAANQQERGDSKPAKEKHAYNRRSKAPSTSMATDYNTLEIESEITPSERDLSGQDENIDNDIMSSEELNGSSDLFTEEICNQGQASGEIKRNVTNHSEELHYSGEPKHVETASLNVMETIDTKAMDSEVLSPQPCSGDQQKVETTSLNAVKTIDTKAVDSETIRCGEQQEVKKPTASLNVMESIDSKAVDIEVMHSGEAQEVEKSTTAIDSKAMDSDVLAPQPKASYSVALESTEQTQQSIALLRETSTLQLEAQRYETVSVEDFTNNDAIDVGDTQLKQDNVEEDTTQKSNMSDHHVVSDQNDDDKTNTPYSESLHTEDIIEAKKALQKRKLELEAMGARHKKVETLTSPQSNMEHTANLFSEKCSSPRDSVLEIKPSNESKTADLFSEKCVSPTEGETQKESNVKSPEMKTSKEVKGTQSTAASSVELLGNSGENRDRLSQTSKTPPENTNKTATKVGVLITGVDQTKAAYTWHTFRKLLRAESAEWCTSFDEGNVTHVITAADDKRYSFGRTLKFLQGVSQGLWILSDSWVKECVAQGRLVPEVDHEIVGWDDEAISGPRTMREAKIRGDFAPLFEGYSFFPTGSFDSIAVVEALIQNTGGEVLSCPPEDYGDDLDDSKTLILVRDHSTQKPPASRFTQVDLDFLLDSITQAQILDPSNYTWAAMQEELEDNQNSSPPNLF
eukprot:m.20259 g.20259  ORF g.20259 m.20259 type:complete len:1073 (+) comp6790_c0_seq1:200-3418(+)